MHGSESQPIHPAEAAALALPPMTDEAIAIVARILATVEKRRIPPRNERSNCDPNTLASPAGRAA